MSLHVLKNELRDDRKVLTVLDLAVAGLGDEVDAEHLTGPIRFIIADLERRIGERIDDVERLMGRSPEPPIAVDGRASA